MKEFAQLCDAVIGIGESGAGRCGAQEDSQCLLKWVANQPEPRPTTVLSGTCPIDAKASNQTPASDTLPQTVPTR